MRRFQKVALDSPLGKCAKLLGILQELLVFHSRLRVLLEQSVACGNELSQDVQLILQANPLAFENLTVVIELGRFEELHTQRSLDFDDLLLKGVELMRHPQGTAIIIEYLSLGPAYFHAPLAASHSSLRRCLCDQRC